MAARPARRLCLPRQRTTQRRVQRQRSALRLHTSAHRRWPLPLRRSLDLNPRRPLRQQRLHRRGQQPRRGCRRDGRRAARLLAVEHCHRTRIQARRRQPADHLRRGQQPVRPRVLLPQHRHQPLGPPAGTRPHPDPGRQLPLLIRASRTSAPCPRGHPPNACQPPPVVIDGPDGCLASISPCNQGAGI